MQPSPSTFHGVMGIYLFGKSWLEEHGSGGFLEAAHERRRPGRRALRNLTAMCSSNETGCERALHAIPEQRVGPSLD